MTEYQKWLVGHRIACPEVGYPISEAKYGSHEEFAKANEYLTCNDEPCLKMDCHAKSNPCCWCGAA